MAGVSEPPVGGTLGEVVLDYAFQRGFYLGLARAALGGLEVQTVEPPLFADADEAARAALLDSGTRLTPFGVELFAEWVAVAATVRVAHGEEPLTRADVDAFIEPARTFLNTVFCDPPR